LNLAPTPDSPCSFAQAYGPGSLSAGHFPIYARDPEHDDGPWWQTVIARLRADVSRRSAGFAIALAIEFLIALMLLSLSFGQTQERREYVPMVSFDVAEAPTTQDAAESQREPSSPSNETVRQPELPQPVVPSATPLASALPAPTPPATPVPTPSETPRSAPSSRIGAVIRSDSGFGPADNGSGRSADSQVVGTAPDGSPLYGARWFREPQPDELSGYLSTASGPGWGLIACRTAPDWRVEDCVILDEYPNGSGIARATQAAAWQFKVRPPRLGGQYQVGSWVRIRIDYSNAPRRGAY